MNNNNSFSKKIFIFTSLLFVSAVSSANDSENGGHINFIGSIVEDTCSLNKNAKKIDFDKCTQNVDLSKATITKIGEKGPNGNIKIVEDSSMNSSDKYLLVDAKNQTINSGEFVIVVSYP